MAENGEGTHRHEVRLQYPSGDYIYAWVEDHEGEPHVKVHWRRPNGRSYHQPFYANVDDAEQVFQMLAAFAASVKQVGQANRAN